MGTKVRRVGEDEGRGDEDGDERVERRNVVGLALGLKYGDGTGGMEIHKLE